jgi:fermentation-respiration switch protein FrsA (DUF1100 family)
MGRLLIPATLSLVAIAVLLLFLWVTQRRMMYFPFDEVPAPAALGLTNVETVTFDTADGLRLGGWFFSLADNGPQATVLIFNGNAGNRAHRAPLATALRRQGLQVLLLDYRGYGGNPGSPTERGLAADARGALRYLTSRADVARSRLIYFGESLGTAVAVDLALEHPPAALVLRSPFTSMADVGQRHYPWLPVRWLIRDRYAASERIRRIRVPLLVIAGDRDRIVPLEFSRRLYEAANQPKKFFTLPDADHNDLELFAGNAVIAEIVRFLDASATMPPVRPEEAR